MIVDRVSHNVRQLEGSFDSHRDGYFHGGIRISAKRSSTNYSPISFIPREADFLGVEEIKAGGGRVFLG